jgi:4-hydroxybenzoate polyprenyltransferase
VDADAPLLKAAQSAFVVTNPAHDVDPRFRTIGIEQRFTADASPWTAAVRALRIHHWLKNLLVFVPVFTSFRFVEARAVLQSGLAALAFCLCASAMYVVNDLFDIEADRAHPRKRSRPFASGALPIPAGAALSVFCLALGLAVAAAVSPRLLGVIATYLAITTGYSLYFKRRVLLDVIVLAVLYTLRLLGGGVSSGISLSVWLIAFSLFTFLSLGLVKRCSELLLVKGIGRSGLDGRDYHFEDLRIFWPMGIAASVASVMVFAFYVQSEVVHAHYRTPALLWIVALGLFYWLSRMWIKTARGEMTDDPLVFAITDFGSRTVIAGMIVTAVLAHFVAFA